MVLDPIPQSLPVHFFGSRPQPPTSPRCVTASVYLGVLAGLALQLFDSLARQPHLEKLAPDIYLHLRWWDLQNGCTIYAQYVVYMPQYILRVYCAACTIYCAYIVQAALHILCTCNGVCCSVLQCVAVCPLTHCAGGTAHTVHLQWHTMLCSHNICHNIYCASIVPPALYIVHILWLHNTQCMYCAGIAQHTNAYIVQPLLCSL